MIVFGVNSYLYGQSNILASDLTWSCIGKDSFMIKLVLYRDCNGAKFQKSIVLNVEDALTGQKITDCLTSDKSGQFVLKN